MSLREELAHTHCSVVYLCSGLEDDICELYYKSSLPDVAPGPADEDTALGLVYRNVRALLDEDQGGLDDVFISSSAKKCRDRVESCANSVPTVVLVELNDVPDEQEADESLAYLRALSADIHGARYQQPVMPFALVTSPGSEQQASIDSALTATCLGAGALDIIHRPLRDEDLHRLVGHIKENVRPAARLLGAGMAQNLVDSIRTSSHTQAARHRPDQTVSLDRRRAVEGAVGQWHFPAQDFSMDELTYAALFMLEHMLRVPELERYSIPRAELMTFLLATRRQYKHQREVHYHNWRHAVDVTQSLYCFLLDVRLCPPHSTDQRTSKPSTAIERLLSPLDALILLISAIGHDVGHPGVNNAFLVACNHPLAQMYNDKSVLENYHCAAYSQLLRRHWPSLSTVSGFRSTMISTILATDMQRHFEYMGSLGELKRKVESSRSELEDWNDKDREHTRELMMALLMKAADISNVARPFNLSSQWARTLMNEFGRQGELEAELGIPTCLFGGPPNKEDILAAAQSQKGFMSLFGIPLFAGMREVMPSVSCAIRELDHNVQIWDQKIHHEKQRRDSGGESASVTFSSVSKKEVDEAKVRHRKSEPLTVPEDGTRGSPSKRHAAVDSAVPPPSHPAHQQREHFTTGLPTSEDHRASAPYLPASQIPLSPGGGASRRSSKDVALESLQQLSAFAHNTLSPISSSGSTSRRESADAGWQMQQSYPGSRRGSKDESLTTILVTSQGSPRRSSPGSPGTTPRPTGSPSKQSRKRWSIQGQKPDATSRFSIPSSRSHATSSATATTTQQSPSTQPSSLAPTEDEPTPPAGARHSSIAATEDPFILPGTWPNDLDGTHRASLPAALPSTPPLPAQKAVKSDSPRIIARMASGASEDTSRRGSQRKERGIRESRSGSRLRGLKFWKKKRDVSGVDAADGGSP